MSAVVLNSPFSCRLKDHCIYTQELQAILFALIQADQFQESKFMIVSSHLLSALQALGKLKTYKTGVNQKFFYVDSWTCWYPGK